MPRVTHLALHAISKQMFLLVHAFLSWRIIIHTCGSELEQTLLEAFRFSQKQRRKHFTALAASILKFLSWTSLPKFIKYLFLKEFLELLKIYLYFLINTNGEKKQPKLKIKIYHSKGNKENVLLTENSRRKWLFPKGYRGRQTFRNCDKISKRSRYSIEFLLKTFNIFSKFIYLQSSLVFASKRKFL